jgi:hypothetical protein
MNVVTDAANLVWLVRAAKPARITPPSADEQEHSISRGLPTKAARSLLQLAAIFGRRSAAVNSKRPDEGGTSYEGVICPMLMVGTVT